MTEQYKLQENPHAGLHSHLKKKACLHNNTSNLLLYQYKTDQKDIIADHFKNKNKKAHKQCGYTTLLSITLLLLIIINDESFWGFTLCEIMQSFDVGIKQSADFSISRVISLHIHLVG